MGLARPDKSRGKPSSLLKNDDDYKQVFNSSIELDIYLWAAKLQRQVDTFILSELAEANVAQKSNLKFHLSMLLVEQINKGSVRSPSQLRPFALAGTEVSDSVIKEMFEELKSWSVEYLDSEGVILERVTKAQRFSDYLLECAQKRRSETAS